MVTVISVVFCRVSQGRRMDCTRMLKEGFLCPYWALVHCLASWQFYSSFLQAVYVSFLCRHTWTLWWTSPFFLGVESLSQLYISASVLGAFLPPFTMENKPSQAPLPFCPSFYHPPTACSENFYVTCFACYWPTNVQAWEWGWAGREDLSSSNTFLYLFN